MKIEKQYVQELGLKAFIKNEGFLFAEFCMGVGKTKLALDIMIWLAGVLKIKLNMLYICHTTHSRDKTIPEDIIKWGGSKFLESGELQLVQYEALDSIGGEKYHLVIYDECHLLTNRRNSFFRRNNCQRILLLSGTRPDDIVKMGMIEKLCKGNILVYDLTMAIKNETVNNVEIKLVEVEMSPKEQSQYSALLRQLKDAYGKDAYKGDAIQKAAVNQRMWFIYKSETKVKAMIYLRNGLRKKNLRFIMFACTKEQANLLSPYRSYSGIKKADSLQAFMDETIDEMASVKQLTTGTNINNLLYGINLQVNSKSHNIRQTLGRFLRGPEGSIGLLYILVLKGTKDEEWVENSVRKIPSKMITRFKLDRSLFENIPL
jgi:superfamily II DNA or RNA helicase